MIGVGVDGSVPAVRDMIWFRGSYERLEKCSSGKLSISIL
jgi:hypothetical protein